MRPAVPHYHKPTSEARAPQRDYRRARRRPQAEAQWPSNASRPPKSRCSSAPCPEVSASYLSAPACQLATLKLPWGRQPPCSRTARSTAIPAPRRRRFERREPALASNVPEGSPSPTRARRRRRPETQRPPQARQEAQPIRIDPTHQYTTPGREQTAISAIRPATCAWLARNAIAVCRYAHAATDAHTADAHHWFFKRRTSRACMAGALTIKVNHTRRRSGI